MGSFTRKARRGVTQPARETTAFQADPFAYFRALRAGVCPYDGTPLTDSEPEGEVPPGLKWCAKCERGFGPVEGGGA
jgi:hypothetical protein